MGAADLDDVFGGQRAEAWRKVIGDYGDPIRMIVVNKLVARALDHFGRVDGRERIAKPHTLILKSIADLPVVASEEIEAQVESLVEVHEDTVSLANEFPSLASASLLDLGSGSGYLGGWLSTLGVRYTGVEPSAELHRAARDDPRLATANLFCGTIRQFCENDYDQPVEMPTLISMIGVVEHLADPEDSLITLFEFLTRRKWLNVPVLVTTSDPDFFLPGLPVREFMLQPSAPYGVTETLGVRDPAAWEELFVKCGFHLLEQRPLHISGLPKALSRHVHELHERILAGDAPALGGSEMEGEWTTRARVPPRQGPFYFWLLCPRNAAIERPAGTPEGAKAPEPSYVETFAKDEPLSVIGNLQLRVYRMIEGQAFFISPEIGSMHFDQNALFGQLETSCNYVSSRVLGRLTACAGSQIETTESRQVLHYLAGSTAFADKLFLSLLGHLSSVLFKQYVSAKRSDTTQLSTVLTGKSYGAQSVRNIAACLLQVSANAVKKALPGDYRSRIVVELDDDHINKFIYGPRAGREFYKLMEILPELVQSNVIDSFSSYSMWNSGAHETYEDVENNPDKALSSLHIGWQAAHFIQHSFARRDAEEPVGETGDLALAVSAFLGHGKDKDTFKDEWDIANRAERRSNKQGGKSGHPKTRRMPRTEDERLEYVIELVKCNDDEGARLRRFLRMLRSGFNYNDKSDFAKKHGLSRFIVVRDVWALIACLLDQGDMWNTAKKKTEPVSVYVKNEEQKPRIIAYIRECIAYAGYKSGLNNGPW